MKYREWATFILLFSLILSQIIVSWMLTDLFNEGADLTLPTKILKKKHTVYVTGAIENPGQFELDANQKLWDLKKNLQFKKNADRKVFRTNRKIRHQEILYIPTKEEKIFSP